jgi:tetratricopeptide (TPR) repeat protein
MPTGLATPPPCSPTPPVAARRAAALGAHREAAAQYARALRFADGLDPAALADLLERHSYECYLTDQLAEATASREQALGCWRALGDRCKEGDTLRWLSRLAWFEGRNADAKRAGRQAAELLEDLGPGPELAMAYSNLSQLSMLAGNTDEALAWGSSAIELAESLGQTEILVHALNNVGTAEMCAGWPDGQATLERSLALALADGLEEHAARAYTNLAFCALNLRDYPLTSRYLADGIRYCTGRDLDLWGLYMLVSEARVDFEQGRWAEATRTAEVVLRDPRTAPVSRINALAVVGRVRARRGDPGGVAALGRGPGAGNRDRRAATAGSGGGRSGRGGLAPRRSGRGAVGGGGRARPGQAGRGPELALADRRARLLAVAAGRARPAPDQWPPGRRG